MSEEIEQENEESSSVGCIAITIAIALILIVIIAIITVLQIFSDEVWLVPGDPDNFDPISEYTMVLDYAGDDARLTRIEALFVKSDGTLDLNASYEPAPTVVYYFYRPTRDNNAPAGTAPSDAIWHSQVTITISQPFAWSVATQDSDQDGFSMMLNLGMDRDRYVEVLAVAPPTLETPRCSFADFWDTAIETSEADSNAVATIIYDQTGYHFLIQGTTVNLLFDNNCELQN